MARVNLRAATGRVVSESFRFATGSVVTAIQSVPAPMKVIHHRSVTTCYYR